QAEAAAQALKSAKASLAATWGANRPAFDTAQGEFYKASALPDLTNLPERIENNPDIARWPTEKLKYRAAFDLEKAKAKSDPTLKGGVKQLNEGDNTAFIIGLTIPLPVNDRNQAGIKRATYAIEKAAEQQRFAETNIHKDLAKAAQNLETAFTEATVLANDVVPGAQTAFDAATQGYQAGKFDYLDVLDAQRTLFEAKGQYIRSLAKYHKAKIQVERLIAQSLDSIEHNQQESK
ncbi:MAG: TolC family protein, partial [Planctomycetota bacterium]